jgi:hypothetical protein
MFENEESDRSKKRNMDVPDEKRITARRTASSQERRFRVTRKVVRSFFSFSHKMDQTGSKESMPQWHR